MSGFPTTKLLLLLNRPRGRQPVVLAGHGIRLYGGKRQKGYQPAFFARIAEPTGENTQTLI
jgi:hypothetical protein